MKAMLAPRHILVLDTNIAAFSPVDELERLASRFTLRVSETALVERWAQSVRAHEKSRERGRGQLFGRFSSIAPLLDPETPVEVCGRALIQIIAAQADGQELPREAVEHVEDVEANWRAIVGVGLTDEEWLEVGRRLEEQYLAPLDDNLRDLARPARELARRVGPELREQNALFDALPDDEQLEHMRRHVADSLHLSPAAIERLDGAIRNMAVRMQSAAMERRPVKRNDGADLGLLGHVGLGHFVLTNEMHLVRIVDESKTYQAPWVRRPDDLDNLPDVVPWGDEARAFARHFVRRADRHTMAPMTTPTTLAEVLQTVRAANASEVTVHRRVAPEVPGTSDAKDMFQATGPGGAEAVTVGISEELAKQLVAAEAKDDR